MIGVYQPSQLNDLAVDVALTGVAQGDLFYRGASRWNNLAAGTAGRFLQTGGLGANPVWAQVSHAGLSGLGADDHTQYALADKSRPLVWVSAADLSARSLADLGTRTHSLLTSLSADDHPQYIYSAPASSVRNIIQPTGDFKPLIVKGFAGQTNNLFEAQDSTGAAVLTVLSDGSLHIGTVDTLNFFNVTRTRTNTSGQGRGYLINLTVDPPSNSSGTYRGGVYVVGTAVGNTVNLTGSLTGLFLQASHGGTGTVATLTGVNVTSANSSGGAITAFNGITVAMNQVLTAATVGEMTGYTGTLQFQPSGSTATRSHHLHLAAPVVSAGATIGTHYGVRLRNQGAAGITTSYAIDIDNQVNSTTPFSIRSQGGQCLFMAGAVGVIPLIAQGIASQTADIFNVNTSGNVVLFGVAASGITTQLLSDATTAVVTDSLIMDHRSSGTPAAGFGQALRFRAKSSTTNSRDVGCVAGVWATATDATRKGQILIMAADAAAEREVLRGESSGAAAMIGFLGKTAVVRPASYTVTGSVTRTMPADPSVAFTGINNAQAGTVYATVADLNTLRTNQSTLLGIIRQLITDLGSTSGFGLLAHS